MTTDRINAAIGLAEGFTFKSSETMKAERSRIQFPEGFDFKKVLNIRNENSGPIAEFVGTGNFSSDFFKRMEYEVESGRKAAPILYTDIYDVMVDANLPKVVEIDTQGAPGVVFEEIKEGGEVKFATVGESTKSITMKHYGTALEYSEDMFMYSQTWRFADLERDFGIAYNALLNHIHLYPIIGATLTGNNATDGTALTSFRATDDMAIKYLRTLEAAITAAVDDSDNPRYGPYVLLCSTADAFTFNRALRTVPQQGVDVQNAAAMGIVQSVIAYNGWTNSRGKKATSYTGVTAGTAFLIDVSMRRYDFKSMFKHELRRQTGGADIKRFVLDNIVWDARFGMYAAPTRAVQKITLPTSSSGAS